MDEAQDLLSDENGDIDASIAYFLFTTHHILPHEVLNLSVREKALIVAMAEKEKKYMDSMKNK